MKSVDNSYMMKPLLSFAKANINEGDCIHISDDNFVRKNLEVNKSIVQISGRKPKGLWYSLGCEWINWLEHEMPEWAKPQVNLLNVDYNKILLIDTDDKFKDFETEYLQTETDIDWKRVSEEYSGIEISPYFYEYRFPSQWYYGWDVASGCLWNADALRGPTLLANYNNTLKRYV